MKQINQAYLIGYDPRCSIYLDKKSDCWFIAYYLPNTVRIRRKCHKKRSEASKLKGLKERQLILGQFDEKDVSQMQELFPVQAEKQRIELMSALELYLSTTKGFRTDITQYNNSTVLYPMFEYFKSLGRTYLDEIDPLDVQLLFRKLDTEGKSEATLTGYRATLTKVFNWFDELGKLDKRNPVKNLKIPKKGGLVRERIPTEQEIQSLLLTVYQDNSRFNSPIRDIIRFLAYTGARVGEALHAEWDDFDLSNGIWKIQTKPNCPTFHGMGWSPKWKKDRLVPLFEEAIRVIQAQPQHLEVFGSIPVRDQHGQIIDHENHLAGFVFPKHEVWLEGKKRFERYSRVDKVLKAWNTLKKHAGVEDLQLKDLRTYFNWVLINRYSFSHKEAGAYLGNSEEVNLTHYTPVLFDTMRQRMTQIPLNQALGIEKPNVLN